ncbi:MAG: alpha/beta hydrolase fold domain-containing protein [Gammaproteobacteria bacterium]|nr:alpha/beta hydrolase fold domain-containing protein [Gammaproteobacteria bacterium]
MSDKSLSEAARNFLQQNLLRNPPLRNSIELPDSHNIERIRRETREGYRVAFESSRRQYTSSDQDISVGGVPCLEINPRYRDQNRGNVVIFYLFGGGYIMGSPEEDLPISAFVANGLGVRTVCPYYRLSPEHVYPAAFNDVFAVYVALTREYGHGQILVVGESAGGYLSSPADPACCLC